MLGGGTVVDPVMRQNCGDPLNASRCHIYTSTFVFYHLWSFFSSSSKKSPRKSNATLNCGLVKSLFFLVVVF